MANDDEGQQFMNLISLAPIIVFAATIFLVFKHPIVRIPFTRRHIHLDYGLAPLFGVLVLMAFGSINFDTILRGILGSGTVTPYAIIILIISLSYICVSLDYTGLFEYISLRFAQYAGGSGRRLFIYFFLLSSLLTVVTENDIVILTMTPIIFYFSQRAKVNPVPYLIAQFFAANILSMMLYIGNPANIIAADSIGMSFLDFLKWMFLPSVVAMVTCLIMLMLIFWRKLPVETEMPAVDPNLAIKNKSGAVFGTVLFIITIVLMSVPTSILGMPLWVLTSISAGIMVVFDIIYYHYVEPKRTGQRSSISIISSRMPWKTIPFVVGLFIIVEDLVSKGWTDFLASQLSSITGSLVATVFGIICLTSFAAGLMNNQPMTIFFVRIFQSPSFEASAAARTGSTLALVAGANFGANLTLVGVLAGILWASILSEKGVQISFSGFSRYGLLVMPVVIFSAGLTLAFELLLWS
ncbi:MAG: SLC13 family permease [Candidatus Hadarchaeum sp.]|uniref:SLC13 family permease n=1 Tax=Candidatus Hadarchaeum sp. TaxID=2883567 RepID=UPI003D0DF2E7